MGRMLSRPWLKAATILLPALACAAHAKTIMVVAPHPDDEAIIAAGIIQSAVARGDTVKVVVVTNGDMGGDGLTREAETVSAMASLGVAASDVIFLGYGDQSLMTLYASASPGTVYASPAGKTQTYGNRGLGGADYHSYLTGSHATYTRANILGDLQAALTNFLPADIYTTTAYDQHPDHCGTGLLVMEAIRNVRAAMPSFAPVWHEALVHWPGWPGSFDPANPYPKPPDIESTPLVWTEIESIPVPAAMQNPDPAQNPKYQAITMYGSQGCCTQFVKANEFFWAKDVKLDIAASATASASTESLVLGQTAAKAIDGSVVGYPAADGAEWVTTGQLAGAWLRLDWPSPVTISKIILHDRPNTTDNILSGTLTFGDGGTLAVGPLPNNGSGLAISVSPARTTSWLQFRVDSAVGINTGLAEIEVQGPLAPSPVLNAIAPSGGSPGASVPVTLTGANFVAGATVAVSSSGVTVSNVTVSSATRITATFTIAANAAPGARNVTVTTPAGTSGAVSFTVGTAAPALTSIAPPSGAPGAAVPVTLTGANFVAGATVAVSSSGVTVSNVAVSSATQITATFTIAANAAQGARDVTVTTPSGTSGAVSFTVSSAGPVLSSIAPEAGAQGATVPVALTGANFVSGATVAVSSTGVTVSDVVVASSTRITAVFTIAANAALGTRDVTVTTPAGASAAIAFAVHPPPPVLTAIAPPTGMQGAGVTVTLTGGNFVAGATIGVSSSGIAVTDLVVNGASRITATFAIAANAALGAVNVTVTTPGGTSSGVPFTVTAGLPPSETNLAPASTVTVSSEDTATSQLGIKAVDGVKDGNPGDYTKEWATLGETAGAWIQLAWASPIAVSHVVLYDRPNLTDHILSATLSFSDGTTVPVGALPNNGDGLTVVFTPKTITWVRLTVDSAGGYNIGLSEFEVFGADAATPAPTLTSIAPASGTAGSSVPVTLTGTNFASGAAIQVSSPGIAAGNVEVVSATEITAVFTIAADAAPGPAGITVTTAGGTSGAMSFTVAEPPPTLTAISPSSGVAGASVQVTLTGSDFDSGTTVAVAAPGITVSNVVIAGATRITATFTIAADAAPGPAAVTVTTSGGTSSAVTFTVTPAAPTLTGISPSSGTQGTTVPVILTGTNFLAGATVSVAAPGVTVSDVVVSSATRITAVFAIAADAAAGGAGVTVATPGGTSAAVTFTLTAAAPTLSAISPSGVAQGASVPVTLTGTNFLAGATVSVAVPGVMVSNVVVASATRITATFAIAADAAPGPAGVTVATAGGTSAAVTFTVTPPAPTLSAISPSGGTQGTSLPVTLTGTNFVAGATVNVAVSGVTVSNVVVAAATRITATFVIGAGAPVGPAAVTVTTAAGTSSAVMFTIAGGQPPTETNLAPSAAVTVSSENTATSQLGIKAVDGVKDGNPGDYTKEWATVGERSGAWIQLQWSAAVSISHVVLYDRPNLTDNVVSGTLSFSDGTTASVGQLPNNGAAQTVSFAVKTITWVRFRVDSANGYNIGLSEFEVFGVAAGGPAPALTSISPPGGAQGASVAVTLTGTNFVSGANVGVSGSGVTVSNVVVASATEIGATFTIASGAATGARNVTVTTQGGTSGAVAFTVNPAAPALTSISPSGGTQGTGVAVILTGTDFVPGASVNVSGSGVTVSNVVVASATEIGATFTIAAGAATGARNVTVTTSGGTSGAVRFNVNAAAPSLTSISPSSGRRRATVSVTLTGSSFLPGATVSVSGSGVSVSNVGVVSPSQVTARFTISSGASLTTRNVTVTTSGGTSGAVGFTITR